MREVRPIKLQVSPNPLVFHRFLWIIGLSSPGAELMRSPEETWTDCVCGGSEEKTTGRERHRTVPFEGRKGSPRWRYEGSLCTRRSSLCWTSLPGVLSRGSVQAHVELTCLRYSLRFLDPLGPKTHLFEPGMGAVLFLSSAREACVKTSWSTVQSFNVGWLKTYEAPTWLWPEETLGAAGIDAHAWLWVSS